MAGNEKKEVKEEPNIVPFSEFLENSAPSQVVNVSGLGFQKHKASGVRYFYLTTPEIQLHCPENSCNGLRFFRCKQDIDITLRDDYHEFFYITYSCSNCRKTEKTFSLAGRLDKNSIDGNCYKFGELPIYGPPTPARLVKLIGPDREMFLKGRRCENQGLGIGAFVYYRRVVENQKNRILERILEVSKKLSAPAENIEHLEKAIQEKQFSKAVTSVKGAIPEVLLINGHNPITLLHSALSNGLHEKSDEDCLEIASSIRIILGELSERLSQALKDEAELNHALSKLLNAKNT